MVIKANTQRRVVALSRPTGVIRDHSEHFTQAVDLVAKDAGVDEDVQREVRKQLAKPLTTSGRILP